MNSMIRCPNCGANVESGNAHERLVCEYCRSVIRAGRSKVNYNVNPINPVNPAVFVQNTVDPAERAQYLEANKRWMHSIMWLNAIEAVLMFLACVFLECSYETWGAGIIVLAMLANLVLPFIHVLTRPKPPASMKKANGFLLGLAIFAIYSAVFWLSIFISAIIIVMVTEK